MSGLSFLSFRELRASTVRINEMLNDDGKIIVTANNKPRALMIQVSESSLEETLDLIRQVRLTRAINNIRLSAQQSGASEMTMDEINAEIAEVRRERRERLDRGANNV